MHSKTKKGLLALIMAILLMPAAEKWLNFIHSAPLYGGFNIEPDPSFSFENWWEGSFQERKNKYINDNLGFRPDFIRLNDQVDFSLFSKLHFYAGELGTHDCIWGLEFIESYLGKDVVGYDHALDKMWKLKKVQDTLTALGKTFVLVHAPNKAYYYPDYFPRRLKNEKKGANNLELFSHVADSLGINQLDFNALLLSEKSKRKEVLFTKQGFHWSMFGATVAADSLVRYIERKRGIRMMRFNYDSVEHVRKARETDDDLSQQLNLVFRVSDETFSYPQITYPDTAGRQRPKAIYIGDSFTYQWLWLGIYGHINSDWKIWFYFMKEYNSEHYFNDPNATLIEHIDFIKEIENTDYIVLMYTSRSLPNIGNGFIDKAYDHYYGKK